MSKTQFLKYILPLLLLGIVFMAPSLKVIADGTETTKTESQKSGEDKSGEDKSGEQKSGEADKEKDDDNDGVKDEQEKAEEREISEEFNAEGKEFKIESQQKVGETKNKFEFKLQADGKLEFEFKFKTEASDSENKVGLKFEFKRLVEFVDNTSNSNNVVNGYDNDDEKVQVVDLEDLTWEIGYTKSLVAGSNLLTIVANATHTNGLFVQFTFFISSGYVATNDSGLITPNAVKYNVEIENFPFTTGKDSLLAAEVKMKHKVSAEHKEVKEDTEDEKDNFTGNDEQQLSFDNNSVGAFFSWAKNYEADGVNKTIVVSPVVDDDEDETSNAKMYFNFVKAQKYFWDPEVGVTRATTSPYVLSQATSSPGFELIAILILPLMGFAYRISKRKEN